MVLAVFGQVLSIDPETFRVVAAIIIGLFGVSMLVPRIQEALFSKLQPILNRLTPKSGASQGDLLGGFILGASLGLVWTPCAGPVLGSILTLVASKQNLSQAAALLFAYALGAGIPMLAIAYGGQAATTRVRALSVHSAIIQRVFGLIIILVAIALLTGVDRDVQTWLIQRAPWLFLNLNINL